MHKHLLLFPLLFLNSPGHAEVRCLEDEPSNLTNKLCENEAKKSPLGSYPVFDAKYLDYQRLKRMTAEACKEVTERDCSGGKVVRKTLAFMELLPLNSIYKNGTNPNCCEALYPASNVADSSNQDLIKRAHEINFQSKSDNTFENSPEVVRLKSTFLKAKGLSSMKSQVVLNGKEYVLRIDVPNKASDAVFAKASMLEKEFKSVLRPLLDNYNSLKPASIKEAQDVLTNHSQSICLEEKENEILSRLTMKGCPLPATVTGPKFEVAPPEKVTRHRSLASIALKVMEKMEKIIRQPGECGDKLKILNDLMVSSKMVDLDDMAVMSYIAANFDKVMSNPMLRATLAGMLHSGESQPEKPFCELIPNCVEIRRTSMSEFRNALISYELEVIKEELGDKASYDDYVKTKDEEKRKVMLDKIVQKFSSGMNDKAERSKTAENFQKKCDQKVSNVFGSGSMATVSGYGVKKSSNRDDNGNVKIELGAYDSYERAHMYTDSQLTDNLKTPFYAPKSCKRVVSAGGTSGIGSFVLDCPTFGRYKGITFNPNHLNRQVLKDDGKHPLGSFPIGYIGGDGGGGSNDRHGNEKCDYVHIHMQVFAGGKLINFVDAFCRD